MSNQQILTLFNIKVIVKILILFISGLYLLGFVWLPIFGYGNYVLINVDFLLPSEWIFLTVIAVVEIIWSFKLLFNFNRELRIKGVVKV